MILIPRGAIVVELVGGNAVVVEHFRDVVGLGGRIVSLLWYTSEVDPYLLAEVRMRVVGRLRSADASEGQRTEDVVLSGVDYVADPGEGEVRIGSGDAVGPGARSGDVSIRGAR